MSKSTDTTTNLDHALVELRAIRSLEAVSAGIEKFLNSQIDKIESALQHCQEAFTQHELLQQRIIEFENDKATWDATQKSETQRLFQIGEKLIAGWDQLEKERAELSDSDNRQDKKRPGR